MVDFTLTDEQKDIRELAHDFAEKEIRPVAWEYDKDGTFPQEVIEKAWEVGLMNSHIDEAYGGPGLDYLSGLPDRGGARLGLLRHRHLAHVQRPGQRPGGARRLRGDQEGVPRDAHRGAQAASFCLTEPDAGSDVSGMRTTAVKKGDKYVINGTKCFITNGSLRRLVHGLREDRQGRRPPRHLRLRRPARRRRRAWTRRRTSSVSAPPTPR